MKSKNTNIMYSAIRPRAESPTSHTPLCHSGCSPTSFWLSGPHSHVKYHPEWPCTLQALLGSPPTQNHGRGMSILKTGHVPSKADLHIAIYFGGEGALGTTPFPANQASRSTEGPKNTVPLGTCGVKDHQDYNAWSQGFPGPCPMVFRSLQGPHPSQSNLKH